MANKKSTTPGQKRGSKAAEEHVINVGGSYIGGGVTIKNGDFVGRDKITSTQTEIKIQEWFSPIYKDIAERPDTTPKVRASLKTNVDAIKSELTAGEKAKPSVIKQHLQNILKMAPDIWEVAVATMANPVAGLSLAASKIAKRAAQDAQA